MPTDDVSGHTVVVLDRKFARAVEYACSLHRDQTRKGTDVPYAAHLLGVASLVLEGGGNQREAIAALLHDAARRHVDHAEADLASDSGGRSRASSSSAPMSRSSTLKKRKQQRARRSELARAQDTFVGSPARSEDVGLGAAGQGVRRALQRAGDAHRPAAIRTRDVGTLQRRCRRPALVLPVVVGRAVGEASRRAQRRAARHRPRDGAALRAGGSTSGDPQSGR